MSPRLSRDRRILAALQDGFPLVPRPYDVLAPRLRMRPGDLLRCVRRMIADGRIRYIGATLDLKRLGCRSTLVAMRVPRQRLEEVAGLINGYPQVTHNYLRRGRYNVWFTVSAASPAALAGMIRRIARRSRIRDLICLPGLRTFKIDARFPLQPRAAAGDRRAGLRRRVAPTDVGGGPRLRGGGRVSRRVLAGICRDLPAQRRPFAELAAALGLSERQAIGALQRCLDRGLIRRFGAVLAHRRVGLRHNVLVVWDVAAGRLAETAACICRFPEVSHCYQRRRHPRWPYNLYSMIHCREGRACRRIIALILRRNSHTIKAYAQLPTVREFKKAKVDLTWLTNRPAFRNAASTSG